MPLAAAPKSSTAMRAATLDPGPARAAYSPDWSFRMPILTIPSEIWAWARSAVRLSTVRSVRKPRTRMADIPYDRLKPACFDQTRRLLNRPLLGRLTTPPEDRPADGRPVGNRSRWAAQAAVKPLRGP